jgi:hypothetical protein
MNQTSHYDTVAFDVRDNASMLFFAATADSGDIKSYLLLMRAAGEDSDDSIYLEINEDQFAGTDVIREAELTTNVLTLRFDATAAEEFGSEELVLTFDDNEANRAGIEAGAFQVLGEKLLGGHS